MYLNEWTSRFVSGLASSADIVDVCPVIPAAIILITHSRAYRK